MIKVIDKNLGGNMMRRIFLVDTENVNIRALSGANLLNENDLIILFVTSKTNKYNFSDKNISILNSKAKIQKMNVIASGKNSLDFQLVSYLGLLIGSNRETDYNYYIVSEDHGFYSSINLLANCSNHKLELIPSLKIVIGNTYGDDKDLDLTDEIIVELRSYGYTNKTITKALIAVDSVRTMEELEINFWLQFGGNLKIFNICKPIVSNYKKLQVV